MSLLLETIRIEKGVICHARYHEVRMSQSLLKLYGIKKEFRLYHLLQLPKDCGSQIYKCRLIYDTEIRQIGFVPYIFIPVKSLKIIKINKFNYEFKFADRSKINYYFSLRKQADDILLVKNDRITDTSRANICFFDGIKWLTPANPLLKGTCRQRLLDEGRIIEDEIKANDFKKFRSFVLINAMLGFDVQHSLPVQNILL